MQPKRQETKAGLSIAVCEWAYHMLTEIEKRPNITNLRAEIPVIEKNIDACELLMDLFEKSPDLGVAEMSEKGRTLELIMQDVIDYVRKSEDGKTVVIPTMVVKRWATALLAYGSV